jgi:hypothetical protein
MFTWKIWKKFITPPEYNLNNQHRVSRFISEWPLTSFFVFTAIKVLFVPPVTGKIACESLTSILCRTTGAVFIYNGVLYEYMPNSIFSDITHGIIAAVLSSSLSHGVLQTCMSMSRRKYPLYLIWAQRTLFITVAYSLTLHGYLNNVKKPLYHI